MSANWNRTEFFSSFAAAKWTFKARWELAHRRGLRGYYAQGRVGQNSELLQTQGFIVFFLKNK